MLYHKEYDPVFIQEQTKDLGVRNLFSFLRLYQTFLAASKNLYGILTCESSRLSSLLAARESFRQEGRQGLKFHTDDEKSDDGVVILF